jgi:esterase/lipase superfamily enzyme
MSRFGLRRSLVSAVASALVLPGLAVAGGLALGESDWTERTGGVETDAVPVAPTDSVWVFTNRARTDGQWQSSRGPVAQFVRAFRVTPVRRDPVSFEVRLDVQQTGEAPLARDAMLAALRERVAQHGGALVLHVHGYSTGLDEATEEAAEMRHRGGYGGPVAVFAWPSRPVGVTWPARGRVLTNAYWQDSVAAAESAGDLAAVLHDLVQAVGADRLVLSAHSMGNQLVAATLARPDVRALLAATPLRAIAFVSPDVDRTHFRDSVVPRARSLAHRRVLYGARNDQMLRISGVVHDGRARAGLFGDDADWPAGLDAVEIVDITDGRSAAPWLGPLFDTHHALRRDGTALTDLFGIVANGAPEAARCALGIMTRDGDGAWRALDAAPPERPWMNGGVRDVAASFATRALAVVDADEASGPAAGDRVETQAQAPLSAAASPACPAPRE